MRQESRGGSEMSAEIARSTLLPSRSCMPASARRCWRALLACALAPTASSALAADFGVRYRAQLEACIKRVEDSLPELYELAIGVRLMSPFSPASRLFSPLLPT